MQGFHSGPVVQWLSESCAFTARGAGSIPGWEIKILRAAGQSQKKLHLYVIYF